MTEKEKTLLAVLDERLKSFEKMNAEGHSVIISKMNEILTMINDIDEDVSAIEKWKKEHEIEFTRFAEKWEGKHQSVKNILWLHATGVVLLFLINAPKFAELLFKVV